MQIGKEFFQDNKALIWAENTLQNLLNKLSIRQKPGPKRVVLIESFEDAGIQTNADGFVFHLADGSAFKVEITKIN